MNSARWARCPGGKGSTAIDSHAKRTRSRGSEPEAAVTLTLDTMGLGLTANAVAVDGTTGGELTLEGAALEFALPSTSWRTVWTKA